MSEESASAMEAIPHKRYFTIGEVSELCQVPDHVLRRWEKEIPKLEPSRRQGRRYYEREDVFLIRQIQALFKEGYSLQGVRSKLEESSKGQQTAPVAGSTRQTQVVRQAIAELETVAEMLKE